MTDSLSMQKEKIAAEVVHLFRHAGFHKAALLLQQIILHHRLARLSGDESEREQKAVSADSKT